MIARVQIRRGKSTKKKKRFEFFTILDMILMVNQIDSIYIARLLGPTRSNHDD